MLVLSRKKNETIVFTLEDGRQITVMLIELRGDKARIGIQASPSIIVHRGEVQDSLDRARDINHPDHPNFGKDYA